MAQIPIVLLVLVVMMALLIIGDLFTEPIKTMLRHRFPNLPSESEGCLMWGALIMTAFVFGLLVMYILLHP